MAEVMIIQGGCGVRRAEAQGGPGQRVGANRTELRESWGGNENSQDHGA